MKKSELIEAIANKTGGTKKDAEAMVNAFTEVVTETLANGDSIQLVGFGTFEVRQRAARQGRNPSTGEPMLIPSSKTPAFKAGSKLKEAVKGS